MRQAIVTGGARGIGRAIVKRLAGAGYRVGLFDMVAREVEDVAAAIPGAVPLVGDVTDETLVAEAFDRFAAVPDLVVNNAGIVRFGPLIERPIEEFRAVTNVNLVGVFIVAREAVLRMKPRGSGHVISMTSINSLTPGPNCGAYPAAKAGVAQLTRQFALECSPFGIRFNAIAPGFIDAGMSAPFLADPATRARRSGGVPLRRVGTAEDVAHAVALLDQPEAAYINGHELVVDGGVVHSMLAHLPRD